LILRFVGTNIDNLSTFEILEEEFEVELFSDYGLETSSLAKDESSDCYGDFITILIKL
jgi:hypothetical protein